jgi:hypothetical protein
VWKGICGHEEDEGMEVNGDRNVNGDLGAEI